MEDTGLHSAGGGSARIRAEVTCSEGFARSAGSADGRRDVLRTGLGESVEGERRIEQSWCDGPHEITVRLGEVRRARTVGPPRVVSATPCGEPFLRTTRDPGSHGRPVVAGR